MKEKRILSVLGQVDENYIAEAAPGKTMRKKRIWRRVAIIAACVCLLLALSIVAYAANWFGLRDLLLPVISGTSINAGKEEGTISLTGYQ